MATATKTVKSETKTPATAKKEKAAKKAEDRHPHADKQNRLPHPALKVDEDGIPTAQFEEIPADFDSKKHQPLKAKNFKNEFDWFEFKARDYEAKVALFREKAEESKQLGNSEDRAKKKKLLAMKKRMAALEAELEAAGVDVATIE